MPGIRHSQLQQLLRTAASLPGPKIELPALIRPPAANPAVQVRVEALAARQAMTDLDGQSRAEIARLRALVGGGLAALARRLEERFGAAIEEARRAWEKADDVALVDAATGATLSETRRALHRAAAATEHPAVRAVALEGLLAFDAACGLAGLAERRLSSLIRLRVRSEDPSLLPGGRPFLDLGRAISEVARVWT